MHLLGRHSPHEYDCQEGIHEIPTAMKNLPGTPPHTHTSVRSTLWLDSTEIAKSMREIKPILFTGVHFCVIVRRWLKVIFNRTPNTVKTERKSVAILALQQGNANLRKNFSFAQFLGD